MSIAPAAYDFQQKDNKNEADLVSMSVIDFPKDLQTRMRADGQLHVLHAFFYNEKY